MIYYKPIIVKNIQVTKCNCYMQTCKGFFIKTREGQTTCLWEIIRQETWNSTHNNKRF